MGALPELGALHGHLIPLLLTLNLRGVLPTGERGSQRTLGPVRILYGAQGGTQRRVTKEGEPAQNFASAYGPPMEGEKGGQGRVAQGKIPFSAHGPPTGTLLVQALCII